MKKKSVLFAILMAMIFLFVGCGGEKGPQGEKTILTLWHYYNNEQMTAFNTVVDEFNTTVGKEKNIEVKAFGKGNPDTLAKAVISSAKGEVGAADLPNVFMAYADTAFIVNKLNKVASLDKYFSDTELSQYHPDFLKEGRFDGENLKIMPIAKATEIFMLNKTDWDTFVAWCKLNNHNEVSLDKLDTIEGVIEVSKVYFEYCGKAFYARDSMSNYFLIGAKQIADVDLMESVDGKVSFKFDKEVLRKLWDSYYVPFIQGYFSTGGRFSSTAISSGDVLAYTGSTSAASYFPDQLQVDNNVKRPIDCIVRKAPQFADGLDYAVQQGAGLVVSKANEKTEKACVEFLKWFTNKQTNAAFSTTSSYMPVRNDLMDGNYLSENTSIDKKLKDSIAISLQTASKSSMYTNFPCENSNDIRTILDSHLVTQAKKDRASIVEGNAQIQDYLTNEHFEEWLASLRTAILG